MNLSTLIFVAAVAAVFGGVWWLGSRLALNSFLVPFFAFLAALLVFVTHSLLGVAL